MFWFWENKVDTKYNSIIEDLINNKILSDKFFSSNILLKSSEINNSFVDSYLQNIKGWDISKSLLYIVLNNWIVIKVRLKNKVALNLSWELYQEIINSTWGIMTREIFNLYNLMRLYYKDTNLLNDILSKIVLTNRTMEVSVPWDVDYNLNDKEFNKIMDIIENKLGEKNMIDIYKGLAIDTDIPFDNFREKINEKRKLMKGIKKTYFINFINFKKFLSFFKNKDDLYYMWDFFFWPFMNLMNIPVELIEPIEIYFNNEKIILDDENEKYSNKVLEWIKQNLNENYLTYKNEAIPAIENLILDNLIDKEREIRWITNTLGEVWEEMFSLMEENMKIIEKLKINNKRLEELRNKV